MKLHELESALGNVAGFSNPIIELEQYPTSAHLASRMIHLAASNGDIAEQSVLDIGCGGGILGIGAALLDAAHVTCVDIDEAALGLAVSNADNMQVSDVVDFLMADVVSLAGVTSGLLGLYDTVVMNPPFGTKRKGMDICFLQIAVQHAELAVYSLHKSSTREYIEKKALSWGAKPQVVAQLRFDIPAMYTFHRKSTSDVAVDLWRIDCSGRAPFQFPSPRTYISDCASVPSRSKRNNVRGGARKHRGRGRGR